MDKVLAFSILSASPADISAGAGFGGSWARLSWRRAADAQHDASAAAPRRRQQQQQQREEDKEKPGSRAGDGREHATGGVGGGRAAAVAAPRFAPEFDGIDCFETIVSH